MAELEGGGSAHPVIVGVTPGQPRRVVLQAAVFARRFGTGLVCAHVNPARYPTEEADDGSVESASIDPDFADEHETAFDEALANSLRDALAESEVPWRTLALAGDVAGALGHLAETLDAAMIVVGTHDRSLGGNLHALVSRSVAAQLAHRQLRPVVVIPVPESTPRHREGTDS